MTDPRDPRHESAHPSTPRFRLRPLLHRLGLIAALGGAGWLPYPLLADEPRTSDRWDYFAARQQVRPLHAAPPAAQALLHWLESEAGAALLASLIDEGRQQQDAQGQVFRREAAAAGYVREDGQIVMLRALVFSEWYGPTDSASVQIGKANAGVPWAIHTHSWGNSMSGSLHGITDDFAYATGAQGAPGILLCLPLREPDGSDSLTDGRLQMIVPDPDGIACFEGRWERTGPRFALVEHPGNADGLQANNTRSRWRGAPPVPPQGS